jgi:Tfp pilus assembly protein PilO
MRIYRRQRQQYFFAVLLGVLGVVNLLFFLILYQPARSEYYGLRESIQRLRTDIQARQQRIELLERLNAQLANLEQDRSRLFMMHFIPRNAGWSEILPKFDGMIQDAQVHNLHLDYSIDTSPQYGLYSVKIRVPVEGPYPNVVNFIKDLENSETFFIISSIDLHGSSSSSSSTAGGAPPAPPASSDQGSSNIVLALNLETFFYQ